MFRQSSITVSLLLDRNGLVILPGDFFFISEVHFLGSVLLVYSENNVKLTTLSLLSAQGPVCEN